MAITGQIQQLTGKPLKYVSTRGEAPTLEFCDVLLTGLARDGGLYVPQEWPTLTPEQIAGFQGQSFQTVAKEVLAPFVVDQIETQQFHKMIDEAYATFHHDAVAPLVQIDQNEWILELFHGPTLAFKDVAMQLLGRLMDHVLTNENRRATIVGATSGDTGGAAIEAFAGSQSCDIFILFPKGKVSPVQQRQMTTNSASNVYPIAIEGNFDDCQALVKAMFNDLKFRDNVQLSGVNSINWSRIMAQIVYYFTAATSLGAPQRPVAFTVPTGNFGDIFAGYVAKKMGLPIEKLIIATNQNDILVRTLETARYEITGVSATQSPSMDIQVSSNFERLLFEASGRDGSKIKSLMSGLSQSGAFTIEAQAMEHIKTLFAAGRSKEEEITNQISDTLQSTGYLMDPHTAVGVHVSQQMLGDLNPGTPMVTLSTAHPAKFPAAVSAASGFSPQLPAHLGDLMKQDEKFDVLPNSLDAVQTYISSRIGG